MADPTDTWQGPDAQGGGASSRTSAPAEPEADKAKLAWESKAGPPGARPPRRGRAFAALVAVALAFGIAFVVIPRALDSGGDGGSTGFRSCIARVFSDVPECSDRPGGDGKVKDTLLNGEDIGPCRKVSNDGCLER